MEVTATVVPVVVAAAEAVGNAVAEAAGDVVYNAAHGVCSLGECLSTAVDAATTVAAHASVEAVVSEVVLDDAAAVGAVCLLYTSRCV